MEVHEKKEDVDPKKGINLMKILVLLEKKMVQVDEKKEWVQIT